MRFTRYRPARLRRLGVVYGGGWGLVVSAAVGVYAGCETILAFVVWTPWSGLQRRWVR